MLRTLLRAIPSRKMLVIAALTASCAALNQPINQVQSGKVPPIDADLVKRDRLDDDVYIGLAFSGGGTRASAFAYGLLQELRNTNRSAENPDGLLKHVHLVSGVSGGSVTAAYYGLYGPAGLDTYRDEYLVKNGEKYMSVDAWNPVTLAKGLSGGANSRRTFGRFLNETIFHGATFADFAKQPGVLTWLNATDIANNTPFLFAPETFEALCSDLSTLPISEAVAASAALPLVFSPIVLESYADCDYAAPDWLQAANNNPEATSALRAYARALESYRDPEKIKFVKLLDGGITDNFGTTGLSLARAKAQNPYGPLTATEAVRLKRILFLVANAGLLKDYKWTQQVRGPGGLQLAMAITNSSLSAATRVGYDVMRLSLDIWHQDLVEFRCGLPEREVLKLRGSLEGWDCTDVKLFVGEVSFEALDADFRDELNKVPTRLRLPEEQVDLTIRAAREAARLNPEFNGFLRSIEGPGRPVIAGARPIAPRRIAPSN